jgi:hypothetical protein
MRRRRPERGRGAARRWANARRPENGDETVDAVGGAASIEGADVGELVPAAVALRSGSARGTRGGRVPKRRA